MTTKRRRGPVLTLPDAARELGVSWGVAYRLVLTRALDAQRVDGRYVVSTLSLRRFKAGRGRQMQDRAEREDASGQHDGTVG